MRKRDRGAPPRFTIRRARRSDIASCVRLRKSLWPQFDEQRHRSEVARIVNDPSKAAAFVCVGRDGCLYGVVEASLRDTAPGCASTPVGYLEAWYVEADRRRQGIGRELVAAAEDWARANGAREMASDTRRDNRPSLSAHKRLGYREVGGVVHFRKDLAKP